MKKMEKLNFLLIILLGLSLLYFGVRLQELDKSVDDLDSMIIESKVTVNNGTSEVSKPVRVTRGSSALQALEKISSVRTKSYKGMGRMISSINGVQNNKTLGTYWLIAYRNNTAEEWISSSTGAANLEVKEGREILFWYGKSSKAPFDTGF